MRHYPPPTIHPPRGSLPVLLSVPHAGRDYDPAVLASAAQGRVALETLEDPLVDRLCWRAIAAGLGAVIQNVPRAVIDCNRDETEVDPAAVENISPGPVGPRARFGLGLIPSRTHRHGALWRRPIDRVEFRRRVDQIHRLYHREVGEGLQQLVGRFGEAILLDCHSMPARRGQAAIVIGDRHGSSASSWVTAEAARIAREAGFRVAINEPYAGGAIIARHGVPGQQVHAVQLEIDRSLYLKNDGRTPGVGFDRIACLIEGVAMGLGNMLLDRNFPQAAE